MLYDTILLVAIWLTTLMVLVPIANGPVTGAWVQLLFLLEAFAFFAYFWMRNRQTLGMQVWRIRVQNADGSRITLSQCVLRFFTGALSLSLLGLGYWWMLFDARRRAWPDIASRSEVVFASDRATAS